MLRHVEEKEMIWDNQNGFINGISYLTNLVAFYDGIITIVPVNELMTSIWASIRSLKWPLATSFSPNWKAMDLTN